MRSLVLTLGLVACGAAGGTPANPPGPAPASTFPLARGARWTYEGTVRWANQAGEELEMRVTWLMEVTDRVAGPGLTGWIVKGHPADLVWSEGEAQRGDWVILVDERQQRYYLRRGLPSPAAPLAMEPGDDLFLRVPLAHGDRMCPDPADTEYCWDVEQDGPILRMTYRTRPDHTVVEFLPGTGIRSYSYGHHGTLAEVDVVLVKFEPGRPER